MPFLSEILQNHLKLPYFKDSLQYFLQYFIIFCFAFIQKKVLCISILACSTARQGTGPFSVTLSPSADGDRNVSWTILWTIQRTVWLHHGPARQVIALLLCPCCVGGVSQSGAISAIRSPLQDTAGTPHQDHVVL